MGRELFLLFHSFKERSFCWLGEFCHFLGDLQDSPSSHKAGKTVLCFHHLSQSCSWAPHVPWKGRKEQNSLKITWFEQEGMSKAKFSGGFSGNCAVLGEPFPHNLVYFYIYLFHLGKSCIPQIHAPLTTSTRNGSQRHGKGTWDFTSACFHWEQHSQ